MDEAQPQPVAPHLGARSARLNTTIGLHSVVDFFSFVSVSLMPLLAARIELANDEKAMLLALGAFASGAIQPVVAWLSDKHDTRVLGTIGMALAVVCISSLGLAGTFGQLALLHGLGTLGVGAFHPPAAAATGQLARRRAMGMSVFFVAGMLGGMAGNVFAPMYVDYMSSVGLEPGAAADAGKGLKAMLWFIPVGMAGVAALGWAIHSVPHRSHDAHTNHGSLPVAERRRRWNAVWLLYAGNVLRFTTNMALVYLFLRLAEEITLTEAGATEMTDELGVVASGRNGPLQAAMQLGMGGFGLVLGAMLTAKREKAAMVALPLFGAAIIAAAPWVRGLENGAYPVSLALSVLAGVGFGSLVPVSLGIAQRLLPHRTSLASGMMLGGAWSLAFVGPLVAERIEQAAGLDAAFYATAVLISLAGVLALWLPGKLLLETAESH